MTWDTTSRRWILRDGIHRWFTDGKERLENFDLQQAVPLHFTPEDLVKKQEKPDEMDYYSLQEFIVNQQRAGQQVARWEVDFYSKTSFPFASVIVVLFGVPYSSIRRRVGYNGDVNPFLTAWLANIAFFCGAVIVIMRVQK
jgi:lipopolysaccharide export system permease protein